MSRVVIDLPSSFPFSTEMDVRIQHINRGNHVGNDAMIAFLNEARLRYMPEQINTLRDSHIWMINADLAVIYKSEAFYGEVLKVEVVADEFHKVGFDLFFRVTEKTTGREVAHAKMAMLLFDSNTRKLVQPEGGVEDFLKKLALR
jgi:acyl-CoA thioester hydrolase